MTYSQCTLRCALAQLDHPPPFHLDQLAHAQQGCADCLDQLVRQNEALIAWVLQRLDYTPLVYEEARQAGRLGLWKALRGFDPARGFAFSTYAVVAIRRHIQREVQLGQRFWRPRPQLAPLPPADPLEQALRSLEDQVVRAWVAQLAPRQAYVVQAYYGLGGARPQTQRALAQHLGLTHQRVQQILQQARLLLALPIYSWEIRLLWQRTSLEDVRAARRAYARFCRKGGRHE